LKYLILIATMTKKIIFIVLYAAFMVSCHNHKANIVPIADSTDVSARVVDQGDPAADGCGWHIIGDDGTDYIPKNLGAAFKQDGLRVIISFTIDGKLPCGFTPVPNEFPAITLTSIKKK
jgi:hypothetical protein